MPNPAWPDAIFEQLLSHQIQQVAYVPDAGHSHLIERCRTHDRLTAVPLTTEEEGVALLAGAWLGGQRGVLLMQSSGVGNCINMLSLTQVCRFPLLMLVTMRGQWGEFNPWQIPMGRRSADALELAGVMTYPVGHSDDMATTVDAAARIVFNGPSAAAVLISQRLIGAKTFGK